MDLPGLVAKNIANRRLLPHGVTALVAVSGGVDSMVLLELLLRLAPACSWRLHAAHFNHQLRGAESDADEQFVRERLNESDVPLYAGRGDVRAHSSANGISIEMAARELRYRFLVQTAEQVGARRIVLAHHADDQVETFWLRLLRGDLGAGLAGMRWNRDSGSTRNIQIVRPLLNIAKAEILRYSRENSVRYREDSSNARVDCQRNLLRKELLPALRKLQPELDSVTLRAVEVLGEQKAFLREAAVAWLASPNQPFQHISPALRREIMSVQLDQAGLRIRGNQLEILHQRPGTPVDFSREVRMTNADGILQIERKTAPSFQTESHRLALTHSGSTVFGGLTLFWEFQTERGNSAPGTEYFDAEAIGSEIQLRFWQAGDRFRPIGMAQEVKLQDLFTNAKIPADERRKRVVGLHASGKIFWVQGLRISEDFKVHSQSRQVLKWSWRPVAPGST